MANPFRIKAPFPKEDIALSNTVLGNIGFGGLANNIYATNELKLENIQAINAKLRSGEEIVILGESTIHPNSLLSSGYRFINNDFPSTDPNSINLVNNFRIRQFCQSPSYRSGRVYLREMDASSTDNLPEEDAENPNFIAYPNPTNDKTSFRYQLEEGASVKIYISNLFGERVLNIVDLYHEKGNYEVTAPTQNLPAGIYLYTLETEHHKITKRLVVMK